MSLTIPDGLAAVASLAGVPAGLFAWDEDKLEATGTAVGDYARVAASPLEGNEQASQQFAAANPDASGDAFAGRWGADAGGTSNVLDTTVKVSAALGLAAGLIKVAKKGVINYLFWCSRQVQLATAGGVGALNAVRATMLVVSRPAIVGHGAGRAAVLRTPYRQQPSALKMNMAKGGDGMDVPEPLPEAAGGHTMKQRFETAEAAEKLKDVRAQNLANEGRNN